MMALEGLRVLDMSILGPGNFSTMILGDLGAEITLIAPPPTAGGIRVSKSAFSSDGSDDYEWSIANVLRVLSEAFNRNKKSMTLNLKTPEGLDIFYRIASQSDIILDGFRPGVAERLKVDYETIRSLNPGIIYCSMSGYGHDGPYRKMPGHDINFIAQAGALEMIGLRGGPPAIPMNIVGDWCTSLNAVIGILSALAAREKSGEGQFVDITYLESAMSVLTPFHYDFLNYGTIYKRGETFYNGGNPFYDVYKTKDDKYFTIGCNEPGFWRNLCRALGREDLADHQYAQGEKKEEIVAWLKNTFLSKTRDQWFDLMKDNNIPIGKVYEINEVFQDPHVLSRGIVVELDHPLKGKVKHIRSPYGLSKTPPTIRSVAPEVGEHTDELLREILGLKKEGIEALRQKNVI